MQTFAINALCGEYAVTWDTAASATPMDAYFDAMTEQSPESEPMQLHRLLYVKESRSMHRAVER
jgi:hypothetical protein